MVSLSGSISSFPSSRDHAHHEGNEAVFADEISSVNADDGGILENCGILSNNCLPCLAASTVPSIEKRRSSISSPPGSARKKAPIKTPFKWKEGQHGNANLSESKSSNLLYYLLVVLLYS